MNTTDHLVADIERLREHLGIERWLVYGGSWGSTLGLVYAQRHPERVTEMVFAAVTMTRRSEVHWCDWEDAVVSLDSGGVARLGVADDHYKMAFARIVTHYFRHGVWLEEGQLLRDAHRLASIPAVLLHGRLDLGGPLLTAWELAQAWSDAELVVLDNAGHRSPELGARVVAATDRFARSQ